MLALRLKAKGRHVAVDGKTSRRSFDTASRKGAVHTIRAWMNEAGLVLGQRKTGDKSNEITAIPELLRVIDIRGATVTIDAMGCQTEIAKTIVEGEGQFLLAVKDNQPTLYQDIQTTFAEAANERRRSIDEQPRPVIEVFEEIDKGHGCIETRTLSLCRDLAWLTTSERWQGLDIVAQIIRQRTVNTSTETAYYIGSDLNETAATAASAVRRHWNVENQLLWVLELAFYEDEARHRAKNTAQKMAMLRHHALDIIKQAAGRKLGVAKTQAGRLGPQLPRRVADQRCPVALAPHDGNRPIEEPRLMWRTLPRRLRRTRLPHDLSTGYGASRWGAVVRTTDLHRHRWDPSA